MASSHPKDSKSTTVIGSLLGESPLQNQKWIKDDLFFFFQSKNPNQILDYLKKVLLSLDYPDAGHIPPDLIYNLKKIPLNRIQPLILTFLYPKGEVRPIKPNPFIPITDKMFFKLAKDFFTSNDWYEKFDILLIFENKKRVINESEEQEKMISLDAEQKLIPGLIKIAALYLHERCEICSLKRQTFYVEADPNRFVDYITLFSKMYKLEYRGILYALAYIDQFAIKSRTKGFINANEILGLFITAMHLFEKDEGGDAFNIKEFYDNFWVALKKDQNEFKVFSQQCLTRELEFLKVIDWKLPLSEETCTVVEKELESLENKRNQLMQQFILTLEEKSAKLDQKNPKSMISIRDYLKRVQTYVDIWPKAIINAYVLILKLEKNKQLNWDDICAIVGGALSTTTFANPTLVQAKIYGFQDANQLKMMQEKLLMHGLPTEKEFHDAKKSLENATLTAGSAITQTAAANTAAAPPSITSNKL